jgi:hypothetical protein
MMPTYDSTNSNRKQNAATLEFPTSSDRQPVGFIEDAVSTASNCGRKETRRRWGH